MWSGGSTESTSLIWFASTVTVQIVPAGRSLFGSSVIPVPGEPLTVTGSGVPVGHSSVNELPLAVTLSLKSTVMLVSIATWSAPSAGVVLVTEGAASAVVNEKTVLAAGWSGGSPLSTSLIPAASTVTVQTVASGRSALGFRVIVAVPEPLTAKLWALPVGHSSVNEPPVAVTGSLKLATMFALGSTAVAPSAGLVVVTVGAASAVNENT